MDIVVVKVLLATGALAARSDDQLAQFRFTDEDVIYMSNYANFSHNLQAIFSSEYSDDRTFLSTQRWVADLLSQAGLLNIHLAPTDTMLRSVLTEVRDMGSWEEFKVRVRIQTDFYAFESYFKAFAKECMRWMVFVNRSLN